MRRKTALSTFNLSTGFDEVIIGVTRYNQDVVSGYAELAIAVCDACQNQGVGIALFECIASIAETNRIQGFTGIFCSSNRIISRWLDKCKYPVSRHVRNGSCDIQVELQESCELNQI